LCQEEIIAAIQTCARQLGRVPTRVELKQTTGVSYPSVRHGFGNMARAFSEAGFDPLPAGNLYPTKISFSIPTRMLELGMAMSRLAIADNPAPEDRPTFLIVKACELAKLVHPIYKLA
jgi:hypothetical protein